MTGRGCDPRGGKCTSNFNGAYVFGRAGTWCTRRPVHAQEHKWAGDLPSRREVEDVVPSRFGSAASILLWQNEGGEKWVGDIITRVDDENGGRRPTTVDEHILPASLLLPPTRS